jgi:hypothetical protein
MHIDYPRDAATFLHEKLSADPAQLEDSAVAPLPSQSELKDLLDISFGASLLEEEHRPVQFRLAFVTADGATKSNLVTFVFSSSAELSPRSIAKLAPAVDPAAGYVGVESAADGLRVWGIIHRGLDREHIPPYFLSVTSLRAGTFLVDFMAKSRLLYSRGQAYFHTDGYRVLTDVLRDGVKFTSRVAYELERLTSRMLSHGHGGTILILDSARAPGYTDLHSLYTHQSGTSTILKDALFQDERAQVGNPRQLEMTEGRFQLWREEQSRRHEEALDFIAQLTRVDGALVMNESLEVLGFGATIRAGDTTGVTLEVSEPDKPGRRLTTLSEFPGNRHRSAILWCAHQQDGLALAIVASQDGDISLFGRTGSPKNVVAIRPFGWGRGLKS